MSKKKKQPKRTLKFIGTDVEMEITKAAAVRVEKKFFHLDQLDDGTWRLLYHGEQFPDFSQVQRIDIIRATDECNETN